MKEYLIRNAEGARGPEMVILNGKKVGLVGRHQHRHHLGVWLLAMCRYPLGW